MTVCSNQIVEKTEILWTEDEVNLLRQLIPVRTFGEISYEFLRHGFFRSPKAVSRKAEKLKLKRGTTVDQTLKETVDEIVKNNPPKVYFLEDEGENDNIEIFIQEEVPEPVDLKEQVWQKILDIKAEYMTQYKHRLTGILPRGSATRKILAMSDFHIPFDREDLIMEIAEKHKDADVVVINGDFTDMHAVSTWPKEKHVVLRKEYDIAMEYLEYFSKNFKHVVLVRGNHEERLNRYFNSNIESCVSFLINKDVLSRLANGEVYDEDGNITGIKKFDNVIYDMNQEPWFVKIGKTVFAHPKTFYSVEGKTGVATWQYFMQRENVDCVVCAHTHQVAMVVTRGKLCIEQGCLCAPLDYEKQGKLRFKPMSLGYSVIYQDKEGNCDFNKSRVFFLGTQIPTKTSIEECVLFGDEGN